MAGLFDVIRIYQSDWKEVSKRTFTQAECAEVTEATVVASKYGKSVCFFMPNKGKAFIPLEPLAKSAIGDKLDMSTLELVSLTYVGTDPAHLKQSIIRVRVPDKEEVVEVTNFNNPFGIG